MDFKTFLKDYIFLTSPSPSDKILPISRLMILPSAALLSLRASPICLTMSPLAGAGRLAHMF